MNIYLICFIFDFLNTVNHDLEEKDTFKLTQ